MSSKFQNFEPAQETWERFVRRLANHFVKEGISAPAPAVPPAPDPNVAKRRAWLLESMGIELYNKLCDKHGPDAVDAMTFAQIEASVGDIVNPAPLILQERLNFSRRKQQQGESAADFLLGLRTLVIKCQFNTDAVAPSTPELARLRDQFICGVANVDLKKRLLQERNLTADGALEIAQRHEQAESTAQFWTQGSLGTVNAISSGKKKSSSVQSQASARSRLSTTATRSKYLCYRCGDHVVSGHKCKAIDAECKNCGIVGHFAKICQKGQRSRPKGQFKSKDRVAEVEVGEDLDWEQGSQESVNIVKATSVDRRLTVVKGSPAKPPGSQGSCYQCGEAYSPGHKCKAIGESCRSCGKVGHFAKVCRQGRQWKQKGKFKRPKDKVVEVDSENTSEQGSEESVAAVKVGNVDSQLTAPKFFIHLGLNSQKVKFVWDTGSGATLTNGDIWRQLGKPALSPCALKFTSYSGHSIPVIRTARVDVKFKRKIFENMRLVVVGGQTFPVVSRRWTVQLGITQAHSHMEGVSRVDGELFDIIEILSVVEKGVKPTKASEDAAVSKLIKKFLDDYQDLSDGSLGRIEVIKGSVAVKLVGFQGKKKLPEKPWHRLHIEFVGPFQNFM